MEDELNSSPTFTYLEFPSYYLLLLLFLRLAYLYDSCALWWVVCLLGDLDTPLHAWRVRLQKGIHRFKIARSEAKGLASLACVIKPHDSRLRYQFD